MRRVAVVATIVIICSATLVSAERNLVPTLDHQPDVCPDQPLEPEWMQNIDTRESHKRLLVQQVYRAQSMKRIVDAEDCACPTRYPTWKSAEAVFFETYGAAEYWDVVEATSEYRRLANALRLEAMPVCEAAGNW